MAPAFETERLRILEMLEEGSISAGDAVQLLNALTDETGEDPGQAEVQISASQEAEQPAAPAPTSPPDPEILPDEFTAQQSAFRNWWRYPLAGGIIVFLLSGLLMARGYQTAGYGFWFFCAWIPLLLGVTAIGFSLYSRTARWLHVRIHENQRGKPTHMAFSFPLPLRPAAWFIRTFGRWIPKFEKTSLDELVLALENNTSSDRPFYIDIQDDENEERVQVFIG